MKANVRKHPPILVLILTLFMFSCTKENLENQDLTQAKQETELITQQSKASNGGKVTIKCHSTCDNSQSECKMQGQDMVISCSCSGCIMELITRDEQGNMTVNEVKDLSYQVNYLDFFERFMEEAFAGLAYTITEITVETSADMVSELYSYSLADGTSETILFAGRAAGTTVTRIDCTGSCDSREQYNLSTNTASCSCSDCIMSVTSEETPN